jgi:DNA-binding LacI/PurR family transcriptional regulator
MPEPLQKQPDMPERTAERLRGDIASRYRPGDKIETIRVLTKHFDVSINTMRAALSILAREGLIEMWQGSGIYVSERVDHRPVGVLMELDFSWPDMSYFWRRVTQQVRLRLNEHGVRNRLYAGFCQPGEDLDRPTCPEFLDDIANDRLSGLIVTISGISPNWAESVQRQHVPIVGHRGGLDLEYAVDVDMPATVREAIERLIAAGRRKLAFIGWASQAPGPDHWRRKAIFDAFAKVLAENRIPLNERWVRLDYHPHQVGGAWEEFRDIWTGSDEKPDGLLVTDDYLFRGVARAIGELNIRVPEQLMIMAHANRGAIEEYPFPLWRIMVDPDAHARAQVDLMVKLLRREPVAQPQIILPVGFVGPEELSPVAADTRRITESIATKE